MIMMLLEIEQRFETVSILSQYIFYRIHVQELNYVIKWNYLN